MNDELWFLLPLLILIVGSYFLAKHIKDNEK